MVYSVGNTCFATYKRGGTFAPYSLLCRHVKVNTIPNQHRTDEELTTYSRQTYDEMSLPAKVKCWLEAHPYKKNALLIIVIVGTCMAIGDGILTPAISVLSAVGGIMVENPEMSNDKVGWLFAPIILIWFLLIGSIGAFNIWKYDHSILKEFNPVYIYRYLRGRKTNLTSLGGIMPSITGTEALFADLCHFPVLAILIAFTFVVFPCLLLAYTGQAAYIMQN